MNIYHIGNSYPEKRCILNRISECNYVPLATAGTVNSFKSMIEKMYHAFAHRYSGYKGEKTLSCYWLMKRDGVVHTFNSCISGKNKWFATFETILPRTNYTRSGMADPNGADKNTIHQFKLLAKGNCLACMALSQATYNIQMSALDKMADHLSQEEIDAIRKKTIVLHPPQESLVTEDEIVCKFQTGNKLELIFVGHDFFRKGGKELIDCLIEYRKKMKNTQILGEKYHQIHLTVISSMKYGDYASHATIEEMIEYKELLQREEWITFYETLPNEKVLELCKKAHIGLLPTFADTYGYSVLEMQACGCAMVTTDIRSLPEINNEDCGWICHLPQNELKEALYRTEEERAELKKILREELMIQLENAFSESQEELLNKALNSWERVVRVHNPEHYSEMLKQCLWFDGRSI